jgi:hypothetical protein
LENDFYCQASFSTKFLGVIFGSSLPLPHSSTRQAYASLLYELLFPMAPLSSFSPFVVH